MVIIGILIIIMIVLRISSLLILIVNIVLKVRFSKIGLIIYLIHLIQIFWVIHYIWQIVLLLKTTHNSFWRKNMTNWGVIKLRMLIMFSVWCLCTYWLFFELYYIMVQKRQLNECFFNFFGFFFDLNLNIHFYDHVKYWITFLLLKIVCIGFNYLLFH